MNNTFSPGQFIYSFEYMYQNQDGERYSHSESEKITFINIKIYRGFCYKTTKEKCFISGHKKGFPFDLCFHTLHDVIHNLPIGSAAYKVCLFNELARQEACTPFYWDKTRKYEFTETLEKLRRISV